MVGHRLPANIVAMAPHQCIEPHLKMSEELHANWLAYPWATWVWFYRWDIVLRYSTARMSSKPASIMALIQESIKGVGQKLFT